MKIPRLLLLTAITLLGTLTAAGVAAPAGARPGAVLRVCPPCGPGYYTTIGAAVAAAQPGDEVQIATGTYTEAVRVTRDLGLRGSYNLSFTVQNPLSTPTTINAAGARHALFVLGTAGAPISVTIDALRLTGGRALSPFPPEDSTGGGLYARYVTPLSLTRSQAYSNTALADGGGGYIADSPGATLTLNAFYFNGSARGAGLALQSSPGARLTTNGIGLNLAVIEAGGLRVNAGPGTTLALNVIGANGAPRAAGARLLSSQALSLTGNLFTLNTAGSGPGGGLELVDTPGAALSANIWQGNTSGGDGAGLYAAGGTTQVQLDANRFSDNSATGRGSALFLGPLARAALSNNAVAAPLTRTTQSEVWLGGGPIALEHNTLLGRGDGTGFVVAGASAVFTNNLVVSTTLGVRLDAGSARLTHTGWHANGQDYSGGVVAEFDFRLGDPLFLLPGDFHLRLASPYVEIGLPTGLDHDADFQARPLGLAPDLGADETLALQGTPTPTATAPPATATPTPTAPAATPTPTAQPAWRVLAPVIVYESP